MQSISLSLPWEYFFESQGISYNLFGTEISGGTAQVVYGAVLGIPGTVAVFFATKIINRVGGNTNLLVFSEVITLKELNKELEKDGIMTQSGIIRADYFRKQVYI